MKLQARLRGAQAGFSLIEILLVLVLIAFVATMVAQNVFGRREAANVNAAKAAVKKVASAVDTYYLETGSFPAKIEDLVTRPGNAGTWNGPYLTESQIKDPWGTPYTLKVPGESGRPYEVISLASDKAPGGKDNAADINNWQ